MRLDTYMVILLVATFVRGMARCLWWIWRGPEQVVVNPRRLKRWNHCVFCSMRLHLFFRASASFFVRLRLHALSLFHASASSCVVFFSCVCIFFSACVFFFCNSGISYLRSVIIQPMLADYISIPLALLLKGP